MKKSLEVLDRLNLKKYLTKGAGTMGQKNPGNTLTRLQKWYASMCNDDWEHTYGIEISNIDNPGWLFKVDLYDTYLYSHEFEQIRIQRENEDDWLLCSIKNVVFEGVGGPQNLDEMILIFLDWAEAVWEESDWDED